MDCGKEVTLGSAAVAKTLWEKMTKVKDIGFKFNSTYHDPPVAPMQYLDLKMQEKYGDHGVFPELWSKENMLPVLKSLIGELSERITGNASYLSDDSDVDIDNATEKEMVG